MGTLDGDINAVKGDVISLQNGLDTTNGKFEAVDVKIGDVDSILSGKISDAETELDDIYKRLDDIDVVLRKLSNEGSESQTAAAMANAGVIDSTSMISTANKYHPIQ